MEQEPQRRRWRRDLAASAAPACDCESPAAAPVRLGSSGTAAKESTLPAGLPAIMADLTLYPTLLYDHPCAINRQERCAQPELT